MLPLVLVASRNGCMVIGNMSGLTTIQSSTKTTPHLKLTRSNASGSKKKVISTWFLAGHNGSLGFIGLVCTILPHLYFSNEDRYNCMRILKRSSNILEFQLGTNASRTKDVFGLCADDNFQDGTWITQGREFLTLNSRLPKFFLDI